MKLIPMIAAALAVYGLAHFYIGLRGWQAFGNRFPHPVIYWILVIFFASTLIVSRMVEKFLPKTAAQVFDLVGSYWMAAMMYLLIILAVVDIVRLINRFLKFIPQGVKNNPNTGFILGLSVVGLIVIALISGTYFAQRVFVKSYTLDVPKKAGNLNKLKIALVSDIHLGVIVGNKRLDMMVSEINKLQPDIVLIAGDIIDHDFTPIVKNNMGEAFKRITSKYGIYACLGNHDYFSGDMDTKIRYLEENGIHILRDENIRIDDSFYVAGREDRSGARMNNIRKSLKAVLEGVDKSLPVIILDHQPVMLDEPVAEGVDIQLSGHTHNGQFFPMQQINKFYFERDYGYLKKDSLNLIVSSGFGTWGPPIRLGSVCEIVDITVTFSI